MFERILCPIDFTSYSHHALQLAVAIARTCGGAITGIHVVRPTPTPHPEAESDHPQRARWDLALTQAQLLKVLREVDAPSPSAVAVLGDPAAEIVRAAMMLPADLIVMASQGRTGIADSVCGSVTARVLGHAPMPVIAVPYASDPPGSARGGFHRIVCAIDFSPASLKALQCAAALAESNRAQLFVVHALPLDSVLGAGSLESTGKQGEETRACWRRRLHEASTRNGPIATEVEERLLIGDPAGAILHLADEEQCDLTVVGGHRGNPGGCVLNTLVTRSLSPVLVTHSSPATHPVAAR